MPKDNSIKSVLLIGSGPIVIGQACEFDYSGTQAIKALKEEGIRVILVNSNPATIMTDPDFAAATYIEPITAEYIEEIIAKEQPDAILPTMGGQTALNVSLALAESGILDRYGCRLIGAGVEAIKTAEDRELFKQAMDEIGLESAKSRIVRSISDASEFAEEIGFPLILRPSRTLGGSGGGIVERQEDLVPMIARALSNSPNREVLVEESLLGWKEFELEVMRDHSDNVVIICGIENIDPMGVHTGDSITVAPIQTLTDKEYQLLREASLKVIRRVGVATGGSNVQFAVNPENGRIIVIEMNPRVSRSSALASKATGFPIAKIAAKLALGYTLDELANDITKQTPACFEPSIDYVVVKIPRFNFEKFPLADKTLGTQMRSVGEVLSFGRCFSEALQKAINSLELKFSGLSGHHLSKNLGRAELLEHCRIPTAERLWFIAEALRRNISTDEIYGAAKIDQWFLGEIAKIIEFEQELKLFSLADLDFSKLKELKMLGFTDRRVAELLNVTEAEVRNKREVYKLLPTYKAVDTCAAEFTAYTPYFYSAYEDEQIYLPNTPVGDDEKDVVIILGSGPNRIGQGIEFDYCCVHASLALKELGLAAVMVNCNPETVSTDYDISTRLYFEPLTLEYVKGVLDFEIGNLKDRSKLKGVIVQFGGQTPLKLAADLLSLGYPILGTSVSSIDATEDREHFSKLITALNLRQPKSAFVFHHDQAAEVASVIGYPLMVRPSFVLGGRAMRVIYQLDELNEYLAESVEVSESRPVLLDRFLENAIEVDVDAVCDGDNVAIAGIMEHIERAGIHSGDSSCSLPPISLNSAIINELIATAIKLAKELKVVGLINIQFGIVGDTAYIIEANPRASRTVPFVSKATGIPWAKIAVKVMLGYKLPTLLPELFHVDNNQNITLNFKALPFMNKGHFSVKACIFPFKKFSGVDTVLGPEMKSTGESMGISPDFPTSFYRAQLSVGVNLPLSGTVFLSVKESDKTEVVDIARDLVELGFKVLATAGTHRALKDGGIDAQLINKVREGSPHIVDALGENQVQMIVNTPEGMGTHLDSKSIRLVATELEIPTFTTMAAAIAAVSAIKTLRNATKLQIKPIVKSIQDYIAAPL
jgi:carbamoyl-phosphate synthase large subunit